jgi:Rieske 2Fe-2S family protein
MSTFLKTPQSYRHDARTLAREFYTSPEIFAEEMARLMAGGWACLGRAEQVANRGDYLLHDVAGESIILLRDQRDVVRAFFNVCRHRGTRLCEGPRGCLSETIQCPYHAWTYGLDGRLIGAPHMGDVEGFDKRDYPLHAVQVREWEGFLFATLAREPEPFDEAFAPLIGRFSRFNLPDLRVGRRVEYDVRANWKLIMQNYSECLHCPMIHPELSRVLPYQSGENDLVEGPFLGGFMVITPPNASATMTGRACAPPLGDLSAEDRRRGWYYSILPNMLLSIHPDYAVGYSLWPQAPDRTRVVAEWLFRPEAFGSAAFNPDDAFEFWDATNRQDWHICELSQAGVSSRAYTPGPYSPRESLPAAWDREYVRRMGGPGREEEAEARREE